MLVRNAQKFIRLGFVLSKIKCKSIIGGKIVKFPNGIFDFRTLWVLCLGLCLIHFHKMPLKISPTTRSASHSELCCSSNPSNWSRNSVLEMFATLLSKSEMKHNWFFMYVAVSFLQMFLYRSDLTRNSKYEGVWTLNNLRSEDVKIGLYILV